MRLLDWFWRGFYEAVRAFLDALPSRPYHPTDVLRDTGDQDVPVE